MNHFRIFSMYYNGTFSCFFQTGSSYLTQVHLELTLFLLCAGVICTCNDALHLKKNLHCQAASLPTQKSSQSVSAYRPLPTLASNNNKSLLNFQLMKLPHFFGGGCLPSLVKKKNQIIQNLIKDMSSSILKYFKSDCKSLMLRALTIDMNRWY